MTYLTLFTLKICLQRLKLIVFFDNFPINLSYFIDFPIIFFEILLGIYRLLIKINLYVSASTIIYFNNFFIKHCRYLGLDFKSVVRKFLKTKIKTSIRNY